MRLRARFMMGLVRLCSVALVLVCIAFFGAARDAQGGIALKGWSPEELVKGSREPWKVDAQKLAYDQKNGVYEAEGDVHIHSGERSLRAEWAKFDTRKREAELRGGVFIRYGQDWVKGEYALWNVDSHTGNLEHGLVFFAKNHFYVQGKHLAKVSENEYEIDDGVITSCDPGRPDWSIRFKHMKVDVEGLGWARDTSFWVGTVPTAYSPILVFPANRDRQSGILFPAGGTSKLNGVGAEIPFYWAMRPDMDATFFAQYMEKRGFMAGVEYRVANQTWGEGIWLFNYLADQMGKDELAEHGYTFEGKNRYWLRSRHNFTLPYDIEGRLDLDLVSDRNYLKEFTMGSTAWDPTNQMFGQFFGRGLINDKNITTRESILYLNHREENFNIGLDSHYWDNLEPGQDQFTLKQMPRLFFDVAPTAMDGLPLTYSLTSSAVNYWREELSSGGRLDVHPRLSYPLHLRPYLDLEPSVGVRATAYAVDWGDDPRGFGHSSLQGRVLPDVRMELSSSLSRVYSMDWGDLKGVQHVFRPEFLYEYIPDYGQRHLPFFDSLDQFNELHDIRYGFSTYLTSKRVREDQQGNQQTNYTEGARLRVTQAYSLNGGPPLDPVNLRFDSLLSGVMPAPSYRSSKDNLSDISFELDFKPARYLTLSYDSFVSPYDGSETGRDLMLMLDSTLGHTLIVDYRTREDRDINELIGQVRLKLTSNVFFTTLYDYSFAKDQAFNQAYGLTYQHGCWALTLAYREEGNDQQVYFTFNLLGLGNLGAGISPGSGLSSLSMVQRP